MMLLFPGLFKKVKREFSWIQKPFFILKFAIALFKG